MDLCHQEHWHHQVQGHLLARPMAGEDAVEWVLARIDRMDGERAARGALTLSALQ